MLRDIVRVVSIIFMAAAGTGLLWYTAIDWLKWLGLWFGI